MTEHELHVVEQFKATAAEQKAEIKDLQDQLVAMDRILSGRTMAASAIASEASLITAPFLHVQGIFDRGTPEFPVDRVRFRLETTFGSRSGQNYNFFTDSHERAIGNLSASSRVIIAIVNPQR